MKMVRMMSQRGTLAGKGDGEGQYGLGFCICWGGRSGRYSEEKKRIGVRRTIVITEEFGSSRAPSKRSSRPPSSSKASAAAAAAAAAAVTGRFVAMMGLEHWSWRLRGRHRLRWLIRKRRRRCCGG